MNKLLLIEIKNIVKEYENTFKLALQGEENSPRNLRDGENQFKKSEKFAHMYGSDLYEKSKYVQILS